MPLNIVVCIKQVPHPDHFSRVSLDPARLTITRAGIPTIINPLDKHALEEGLRYRERFSGRVIALSMGPPQARQALEEALAMGADEAILLCDGLLAGGDTLATAHALAFAIRRVKDFDLILCGNETVDSGTGQVGPQVAELLDIPHVTYAQEITFTQERNLIVRRALEGGYMRVEVGLPALVAVTKEINRPRLATIWGIAAAASKRIETWGTGEIGASPDLVGLEGSPTRVIGMYERKLRRVGEILSGPPRESAEKVVGKLRQSVVA